MSDSPEGSDGRYEVTVVSVGVRRMDAGSASEARNRVDATDSDDVSYVIVEDRKTGEEQRFER